MQDCKKKNPMTGNAQYHDAHNMHIPRMHLPQPTTWSRPIDRQPTAGYVIAAPAPVYHQKSYIYNNSNSQHPLKLQQQHPQHRPKINKNNCRQNGKKQERYNYSRHQEKAPNTNATISVGNKNAEIRTKEHTIPNHENRKTNEVLNGENNTAIKHTQGHVTYNKRNSTSLF